MVEGNKKEMREKKPGRVGKREKGRKEKRRKEKIEYKKRTKEIVELLSLQFFLSM